MPYPTAKWATMSEEKIVVRSIEDDTGVYCVDIARHADGGFHFKEYRRDPEDEGRWTLIADYSHTSYATEADAIRAASDEIPWLKKRSV
jgi:hypothetical protein